MFEIFIHGFSVVLKSASTFHKLNVLLVIVILFKMVVFDVFVVKFVHFSFKYIRICI
jgi:hypothetical protein